MKESYRENLASYSGLEPYAGDGNITGVASARGNAPPAIELGKSPLSRADLVLTWRRQHRRRRYLARRVTDAAESENLCMRRHSKRENREILLVSVGLRETLTSQRNGQKTFWTVMLT